MLKTFTLRSTKRFDAQKFIANLLVSEIPKRAQLAALAAFHVPFEARGVILAGKYEPVSGGIIVHYQDPETGGEAKEWLKEHEDECREAYLDMFYTTFEGAGSQADFPAKVWRKMQGAADEGWLITWSQVMQGKISVEGVEQAAYMLSWFYSQELA